MKIREPHKEYKKNGFDLIQCHISMPYAIYRIEKFGRVNGYEVQKLGKIKTPSTILERFPNLQGFDMYWSNPSNEDFGRYGWCFQPHEYDKAVKFMENKIKEDEQNTKTVTKK